MKQCVVLIYLLILCLMPLGAIEQEIPRHPESSYPWYLSLEYSLGISNNLENSEKYWTPLLSNDFTVNLTYPLGDKFNLKTGLGYVLFASRTTYYHPEPYVMEMYANMRTEAIRIPISLTYDLGTNPEQRTTFIGLGLYADLTYEAMLDLNKHYVVGSDKHKLNFKDELNQPQIGASVAFGFKSKKLDYGLRSTFDTSTIEIAELENKPLRRYYIGAWIGLKPQAFHPNNR